MDTRLTIDKAGRVVKRRPVRNTGPLTKECGVRVLYSGEDLPASATEEALQKIREERDLANFGKVE